MRLSQGALFSPYVTVVENGQEFCLDSTIEPVAGSTQEFRLRIRNLSRVPDTQCLVLRGNGHIFNEMAVYGEGSLNQHQMCVGPLNAKAHVSLADGGGAGDRKINLQIDPGKYIWIAGSITWDTTSTTEPTFELVPEEDIDTLVAKNPRTGFTAVGLKAPVSP